MTKEQKVLIQLIIRSNCEWNDRVIRSIRDHLEITSFIKEDISWEKAIHSTFPLICVGCGSEHGKQTGYPFVLTHCPMCTEKKLSPLPYKEQYLWPGEAKVKYIEQAFLFANDHTRDYYINGAMNDHSRDI